MKNASFPRWSAPIVGPIAGLIIVERGSRRHGVPFWWELAIFAGGLGFAAGMLMLLLGGPIRRSSKSAPLPEPLNESDILEARASEFDERDALAVSALATHEPVDMFLARFMVFVGLVLFCVPLLGAIFAVGGLITTWRIPSRTRVIARLSIVLNAIMTTFWIVQAVMT
jgi:hypothetical protein